MRLIHAAVVFLVSLLVFGIYFSYDAPGAVAPQMNDAGFSSAQVGLLYSAYSLPACVTVAIGGMLVDRFGVLVCITVFLATTCVGTLLTVIGMPMSRVGDVSSAMPLLLVGRVLLGASGEIVYSAQGRLLVQHIPQKSLSIAFSLMFCMGIIGTFASLNLLPLVTAKSNLRVGHTLALGACLFSFAVLFIFLCVDRRIRRGRPFRAGLPAPAAQPKAEPPISKDANATEMVVIASVPQTPAACSVVPVCAMSAPDEALSESVARPPPPSVFEGIAGDSASSVIEQVRLPGETSPSCSQRDVADTSSAGLSGTPPSSQTLAPLLGESASGIGALSLASSAAPFDVALAVPNIADSSEATPRPDESALGSPVKREASVAVGPLRRAWRGLGAAVGFRREYWLIACTAMLGNGLLYAYLAFFPDIVNEKFNMTPEDASRVTSVASIVALVAAPLSGLFIDRFGHALSVFTSVYLMLVAGFSVLAFSEASPFFTIVPLGFLSGMQAPIVYPIVSTLVPDDRYSTALGFIGSGSNVCLVFLTFAVGFVRDEFGSYQGALVTFVAMAGFCLVLLVSLFWFDRRQGGRIENPVLAAKDRIGTAAAV